MRRRRTPGTQSRGRWWPTVRTAAEDCPERRVRGRRVCLHPAASWAREFTVRVGSAEHGRLLEELRKWKQHLECLENVSSGVTSHSMAAKWEKLVLSLTGMNPTPQHVPQTENIRLPASRSQAEISRREFPSPVAPRVHVCAGLR